MELAINRTGTDKGASSRLTSQIRLCEKTDTLSAIRLLLILLLLLRLFKARYKLANGASQFGPELYVPRSFMAFLFGSSLADAHTKKLLPPDTRLGWFQLDVACHSSKLYNLTRLFVRADK